MKESYTGLTAVPVPFSDTNQVVAASYQCRKIYVTHFDFDYNNLCDQAENPMPGGTWTELWMDSPW